MNAHRSHTDHSSDTTSAAAADSLGPLVRVDGRWFIGDHQREAYIALLPEGFEHRVTGRAPRLVPWDRLMDLTVAVTSSRFLSTPAGGLLSKYSGITIHGSTLRATVRHPYDVWVPRFIHHRRWYPALEIAALDMLLGSVVELGRAERLGDNAWLRSTVRQLAPHHFYRKRWNGNALDTALRDVITRQG
ncbi:hypothetical protein [Kitasatospora sp. NPDC050543]|uniref:hypothetical protein n=1 Tax=Kitasatospora sp. NPDC050543 TaxID=3364054 RepID=UPI00378788AD